MLGNVLICKMADYVPCRIKFFIVSLFLKLNSESVFQNNFHQESLKQTRESYHCRKSLRGRNIRGQVSFPPLKIRITFLIPLRDYTHSAVCSRISE